MFVKRSELQGLTSVAQQQEDGEGRPSEFRHSNDTLFRRMLAGYTVPNSDGDRSPIWVSWYLIHKNGTDVTKIQFFDCEIGGREYRGATRPIDPATLPDGVPEKHWKAFAEHAYVMKYKQIKPLTEDVKRQRRVEAERLNVKRSAPEPPKTFGPKKLKLYEPDTSSAVQSDNDDVMFDASASSASEQVSRATENELQRIKRELRPFGVIVRQALADEEELASVQERLKIAYSTLRTLTEGEEDQALNDHRRLALKISKDVSDQRRITERFRRYADKIEHHTDNILQLRAIKSYSLQAKELQEKEQGTSAWGAYVGNVNVVPGEPFDEE